MDAAVQAIPKRRWIGAAAALCAMLLASGATLAPGGTVAAASPTATFGKTNVGGSSDTLGANRKRVNRYSLPAAGSLTKLTIYLAPTSTAGQEAIAGVLYADSNGSPGAALATTTGLTFQSTGAAGWYDLPFPAPVSLAPGAYWIGIITGNQSGVAAFRYDSVANSRYANANTYTAGPSSPFGVPSVDSDQMSLYATYSPAVVPPPPANSSPPTISGTAQGGQMLTAGAGAWTNTPSSYSYQWQRCDSTGSSCNPIARATSSSYGLTSADVGSTVAVAVSAANAGGTSSPATSSRTAVIAASSQASDPPPPTVPATTYYVSPSGADSNYGTSPDQPWRTVARVNNAPLNPGDAVLFQAGQAFSDSTLMPNVSGTSDSPIVFGSYGAGQATLTRGTWFVNHDYLTFDNLAFGPQQGLQGGSNNGATANHIIVQRCAIGLSAGNALLGIYANGNSWTIQSNTIQNTGDSGMLLNGDSYTISHNTIANTGLSAAIPYGKHGIYLKVSNAIVSGNTISNFSDDGVSVRYRNSVVSGNQIAGGPIGIAWFQDDAVAGTSQWTNNTITNTTSAGIYVSASDQAGPTIESFAILGNTIHAAAGVPMNLQPTTGSYTVQNNSTS